MLHFFFFPTLCGPGDLTPWLTDRYERVGHCLAVDVFLSTDHFTVLTVDHSRNKLQLVAYIYTHIYIEFMYWKRQMYLTASM